MRTASISEAKNRLSELIGFVRGGHSVLILSRGRPVARLEPVRAEDDDPLADLVRRGLVSPPPKGKLPKDFFTGPLPKARNGVSVTQILLEERESGR